MNLPTNSSHIPGLSFSGPIRPSPGPRWPGSWVGRAGLAAAGASMAALEHVSTYVRSLGLRTDLLSFDAQAAAHRAGARLDSTNWPSRPLRVGLISPTGWGAPITDAGGAWETEWFAAPGDTAPESVCEHYALDAVVRPYGRRGLEVLTLEAPAHEAGWYDWAAPRPLSYPAVFPTRFDCARLTLEDAQDSPPGLVRALIEAAAVLSRHPARLTLRDRLQGRRPYRMTGLAANERLEGLPVFARDFDAPTRAVSALAAHLGNEPLRDACSYAASRLVGAFMACAAAGLEDGVRLAWMETSAAISAEEPETMLRLGAVRLGCLQDQIGLDAIARADRMLRDREIISGTSQDAFILSELQHSQTGSLTVGRLAAGICMLVSTVPAERVPYFRDDLLDDMRFSDLLLGRDQDLTLLMEVFRILERARRVERFGLPQPQAQSPNAAKSAPAARASEPQRASPRAKATKGSKAAKIAKIVKITRTPRTESSAKGHKRRSRRSAA